MVRLKPPIEVVASDLGFIEGPVVGRNGCIYVCDIKLGAVKKVMNGESVLLAELGGGPNGLALGPGSTLYVANNGGAMRWQRQGDRLFSKGFKSQGFDSRIEVIDLDTGGVERLIDTCQGRRFQAIDDLVFDKKRGFWFTDLGRDGERSRSYGGLYYSDGMRGYCNEVAYPIVNGANGIGLSPAGCTLYATEYGAGRLWAWSVEGPGILGKSGAHPHGGRLVWQAPDAQLLDSLKVTKEGNIVIACQPAGVLCVISPTGDHLADLEMPEHFPTNLCFDPDNPGIAYVTLSSTGQLARISWDESAF